jgi:hypothetical protein
MFERPACVDCHRVAPQTNSEHTLISASFGWRLARAKAADGSATVVWRCPTCWRQYKATSKAVTGS